MIVLRESDYRPVPWKNGGGITREILREPAEPARFDWRLSLATIDRTGPFSPFVGYARNLILVRGAGVQLGFGPDGGVRLDAPGQMATFDGAWQTDCELLDGPSTDLNLIVCKERVQWVSRCLQLTKPELIDTAGWTETVVCCISGAVELTNMTGTRKLVATDTARCSPGDAELVCRSTNEPGSTADPITAQVFIAAVRHRDSRR